MSLATLERKIVDAARRELRNPKLRRKDLMEWSTGEIEPQAGEIVLHLADLGVWVAIPAAADKRPGKQRR